MTKDDDNSMVLRLQGAGFFPREPLPWATCVTLQRRTEFSLDTTNGLQ